MVLNFDPEVSSILETAGWTPARIVNIDSYLAFLQDKGFILNSYAKQMLERLGGCNISCPSGALTWFSFDWNADTIFVLTPKDETDLENITKEHDLSPVGQGEGYVLFVSTTGTCYLLHDEWLSLVKADSIQKLFRAMLLNDRSEVVDINISTGNLESEDSA